MRWSYGLTSIAVRLRFADHLVCYGDIFWCSVQYFLNPIFYIPFFSFNVKFAKWAKKITGLRLYHHIKYIGHRKELPAANAVVGMSPTIHTTASNIATTRVRRDVVRFITHIIPFYCQSTHLTI